MARVLGPVATQNCAADCPCSTVTVAGTVTSEELLRNSIVTPPAGAGAER